MFRFILVFSIIVLLQLGSLSAQDINSYNRAVMFIQEQQYEAAIQEFHITIESQYRILDSYIGLIQAYVFNEQPNLALETSEEALNEFPNKSILRYIRGEVLKVTNKSEAISEFKSLLLRYSDLEDLKQRGITEEMINNQVGTLYAEKGSLQFEQNNLSEAIVFYEKALEFSKVESYIYNNLIYLLILTDQHQQALSYAEEATHYFPEVSNLQLLKNQALSLLGNRDESLEGFRRLYNGNPSDPVMAISYGQALIQNNKLIEAGEHFNAHLQNFPDQREVYKILIQMNRQRFDFTALAEVYERKVNYFNDEPVLKAELARSLALSNQFERAVEVYEDLFRNDDCIQCLQKITEIYLLDEQIDKAIRFLQLELDNLSDRLLYDDLLLKLLIDQGELEKAYNHLQGLQLDTNISGILMYRDLQISYLKGESDVLNEKAENFVARFPGYSGLPYLILSEYDSDEFFLERIMKGVIPQISRIEELSAKVEESAQRALSGSPDLQIPIIGVAQQLNNHQQLLNKLMERVFESDDPDKIEDFFMQLYLQFPAHGSVNLNYAKALAQNNQTERAVEILENVLERKPNELSIHKMIGEFYYREGNLRGAILAWERAFTIDDTNPEIYISLIRLHRENGSLDSLINRWSARYRTNRDNDQLKNFLIEALHRADRFDEARDLIAN
jgi:tetratricopeptide (TPR) repeat protein